MAVLVINAIRLANFETKSRRRTLWHELKMHEIGACEFVNDPFDMEPRSMRVTLNVIEIWNNGSC